MLTDWLEFNRKPLSLVCYGPLSRVIECVERRTHVLQEGLGWANLLHPSMIQDDSRIEVK